LILVGEVVHFQNLNDAQRASLSVLRNSRWRPRWPPPIMHISNVAPNICFLTKFVLYYTKKYVFMAKDSFYGNTIIVGAIFINKFKMASKMAATNYTFSKYSNKIFVSQPNMYCNISKSMFLWSRIPNMTTKIL